MIWFLLLVAIALAVPFVTEARRPAMTAERRTCAPGQFTTLSGGVTHYQWRGKERGPVAVCVHGLTTPSHVYSALSEGLGQLGFRVLVYDLYGRGYSDRPRGRQDRRFFLSQLEELLADQGVPDDITLVGYSMGGAISTAFAAEHPERLRRLVLLAPAGMGHDLGWVSRVTRDVPVLGDWLMQMLWPRAHRTGVEAERETPSYVEGIVDYQFGELETRGFVPAVLSSLRGVLSEVQEEDHHAISRIDLPVLAIWGRDDTTIPIRAMGVLAQWNRAARHEVIEGAGHGLTYTHTPEIIDALREEIAG